MSRHIAVAVAAVTLLAPVAESARKSPLDGQPAVRHKIEYRAKRGEVAPTFEATIGASYQHTISVGPKIEYHLSDTLSVGGSLLFGTSVSTGLYDVIRGPLPEN